MEKHFDFDDLEDFYREWHKEVPLSWEEFKRRGIYFDPERPLDYELYERPIPAAELKGSETDPATGVVYGQKKGKRVEIGITQGGKAVRGFPTPGRKINVRDEIFPLAAKHVGLKDDINASPVPCYDKVPGHKNLKDGEYIFTTFKWNVHTQGRSGHWKHAAEIVHTNPALLAPETAKRLGVKDGDEIEITTLRPATGPYKAGKKEPVGTVRNRVKVMPGMNARVIACSHHVGHWEHGPIATAGKAAGGSIREGMDPGLTDADANERVWWSKSRGGPGGGVHINDALPIAPNPLVGGQNWFDTVCRVRKV
jgi:anaerobic selenocysteine-containing dehydrogenase